MISEVTDRLLSVEEAAQRLSISPWTVRLWGRQGRIRLVKLGRRRVIAEREIQEIIERVMRGEDVLQQPTK